MIRYIWREGRPLAIKNAKDADAQTIGTALEQIREANEGPRYPKAVVEAARARNHPLHRFFEWDDAIAAEKQRLADARFLISCIAVASQATDSGQAAAFVPVRGKSGIRYHSRSEVRASQELREAVLAQCENELAAFQRRFKEFSDVCAHVAEAERVAKARRNKARVGKGGEQPQA